MLKNRTKTIGSIVVAGSVVAVVMAAWAGPLQPPPGPVQPTGVTLETVQQSVEQLMQQPMPQQFPRLGYRLRQIPNVSAASPLVIATGSGRVSKIKYAVQNSARVRLSDANGTVIEFRENFAPQFLELDLKFVGHLTMTAAGTTGALELTYAVEGVD